MIPTAQHVRIASRLYEVRRTARFLLGDRYLSKMAELGAALQLIAAAKGIDVLQATTIAVRESGAEGINAIYILAAGVELVEPSAESPK